MTLRFHLATIHGDHLYSTKMFYIFWCFVVCARVGLVFFFCFFFFFFFGGGGGGSYLQNKVFDRIVLQHWSRFYLKSTSDIEKYCHG